MFFSYSTRNKQKQEEEKENTIIIFIVNKCSLSSPVFDVDRLAVNLKLAHEARLHTIQIQCVYEIY